MVLSGKPAWVFVMSPFYANYVCSLRKIPIRAWVGQMAIVRRVSKWAREFTCRSTPLR